jgi:hypothetical protein
MQKPLFIASICIALFALLFNLVVQINNNDLLRSDRDKLILGNERLRQQVKEMTDLSIELTNALEKCNKDQDRLIHLIEHYEAPVETRGH